MAEIYSSSEASALSTLSQEAIDHINGVLADLGLAGTAAVAVQESGANTVTAAAGDQVIVAGTHAPDGGVTHIDNNGQSVAVVLADDGAFQLTGLGNDTVFAGDGGSSILAGAGNATIHGGRGADSISGGSDGGNHLIFSGGGNDTLVGGNGMDTLWGGEDASLLIGGVNGHTEIHAGTGGGDTIHATGGADTIHGGQAHIFENGGSSLILTDGDVVQVHGSHDTIDGSASAHGSAIDVFGSHSTIIGGSGNDTIALHDTAGAPAFVFAGAGDDSIAGSMGGHATLSGGAGNDSFSLWGMSDSVVGGDGSDVFAIAHYGSGHDTIDGGAGSDNVSFHDRAFADAHFASDGATTVVSFGDGYSASLSGIEHIQFRDTVYNI